MTTAARITVRIANVLDVPYASVAERLIREAAAGHDIAMRPRELLEEKIRREQAAVAIAQGELIGFGYYSAWEDGEFVSHSGLVVREDYRGRRLAREIKLRLFEASRLHYPDATLMSLTTSPAVKALNMSLGFKEVPLERLTTDPVFWEGCKACRNYERIQAEGKKCCCEAMILEPEDVP